MGLICGNIGSYRENTGLIGTVRCNIFRRVVREGGPALS